ncbi:intradiol ring-cleavage dioxygenase [Virgisporangium ochraceum]|nr:intradiol ring-cleavage dioxygenase [Virgisporangium ochraceum]
MTAHDHDDLHDRGLQFDLSTLTGLLRRRRLLGLFAGAGAAAALAACGDEATPTSASPSTSAPSASASTPASGGSSYTEIPEETAGPYPGDGSNGPNVLSQSGIVRSDITTSFGSGSGTAAGVPLTINLTVLALDRGAAAYSGAAVYLWHCDREGRYSMYSEGVQNENYLRGVQEANGTGLVTFRTIFPAAYSGRWPHVHFEVYPTLSGATSSGNRITTSQLALPEAVCDAVYATDGYSASVRNMERTSLTSDMVFRDGWTTQLATVTGDVSSGYVANLTVPV